MTVIPDPILATVLVIPFLVTFIALNFIIFRPLFDYMDERDEASRIARKEADELGLQVEERLGALQTKLDAARTEVAAHRAAARVKAHHAETDIISAARAAGDQRLKAAVVEITQAREQASEALRLSSSALSTDIVVQVLGRDVQAQG